MAEEGEQWRNRINEEVARFTRDTGVSRAQLARALGLYDAALYPSHLNDPRRGDEHRNRILFAVNGHDLFQIAYALGLDDKGIKALKRLCASLYRDLLGLEIDFKSARATLREAVELGHIADEQYGRDRWEIAVPRLRHAWDVLSQADADGPLRPITLRVGTQLASWHNAQGTPRTAMTIIRPLLIAARDYREGDPTTLRDIANLHLVTAMTDRHQGLASPADIIRRLREAQQTHRDGASNRVGEVSALRDMAKPYLVWGLGWRGRPPDESRIEDAQAVARQSEEAAGGGKPRPDLTMDWLFSRLNRIEVLALDPRDPHRAEIQRLWDDMMERDWVRALLGQPAPTALKAKQGFAALALEYACGGLGVLAARALAFQEDPGNAGYQDRVNRAERLVALALAGNDEGIRRVFLE